MIALPQWLLAMGPPDAEGFRMVDLAQPTSDLYRLVACGYAEAGNHAQSSYHRSFRLLGERTWAEVPRLLELCAQVEAMGAALEVCVECDRAMLELNAGGFCRECEPNTCKGCDGAGVVIEGENEMACNLCVDDDPDHWHQ